MKYPMHMSASDAEQLKYEVVSDDLMVLLTRKLEAWAEEPEHVDGILVRKNRLLNKSRTISGGKVYVLKPDDMGEYWTQEHAYHDGAFKVILRELSTVEFAEFASDLIQEELLDLDEMNQLLDRDNVSFRFSKQGDAITVAVRPIEDMDEPEEEPSHPNVRLLVHRMESSLKSDDYAGVVHASASIFETLAKDIVGIPSVQDQTLKSFFDRYRKDSALPPAVLDYMLETYETRNVTPLAGHGSTKTPAVTKEQAVVLVEMTKAFVMSEYKLRLHS